MVSTAPLRERKERLRGLLFHTGTPLHYSDHQIGRGPEFYAQVCAMSLEGIISKRADAPYTPGDCGLWLKVKCENREEFVVVGSTDPEGARPWLGALLLAYYPNGRLVYAGRVGAGIGHPELGQLWRRLQPLATSEMPLDQCRGRGAGRQGAIRVRPGDIVINNAAIRRAQIDPEIGDPRAWTEYWRRHPGRCYAIAKRPLSRAERRRYGSRDHNPERWAA